MSSSIENWSPSAQQTFKFLKKCKCWKQKTSTVTRTLLYQTYLCFCTMFFIFWSTVRWPKDQKEARKPSSGELPPQITKNNHNNERDHQEGRQQEQEQHQTTTQTSNIQREKSPLGMKYTFR